MKVSVYIPHSCIKEYLEDANKKIGVCEVMPKGIFMILDNGEWSYQGLVCGLTDGRQTGVGAEACTNCTRSKL